MSKISLKSKLKRFQEARERLLQARKHGPELSPIKVACAVVSGNQWVRKLVSGEHLPEGVAQFELSEEELEQVEALKEMAERTRLADGDLEDFNEYYDELMGTDLWL